MKFLNIENNEESEEEDDFDNDEKLIIDTPIYDNKINSYIVDTPKVPEEIIATPFSGTNIFILLNNEYFTINISEYESIKTNNNNIDLLEL